MLISAPFVAASKLVPGTPLRAAEWLRLMIDPTPLGSAKQVML
jgi:hypothetical protein